MDEQKPRDLPRFTTKKKVKVLVGSADDISDCIVEDLHLKGMCMSFNQPLPKDQIVRMCVKMGDYFDPIKFEAKILWEKEEQGRFIYGLEFSKIADVDKNRIYNYLSDVHYDQFKNKWFS